MHEEGFKKPPSPTVVNKYANNKNLIKQKDLKITR